MNNPLYDNLSDDLLEGADAIGSFMGWSRRRVFYMAGLDLMPIFRIGNRLTARKSTLRRRIEDMEKAARRGGGDDVGAD